MSLTRVRPLPIVAVALVLLTLPAIAGEEGIKEFSRIITDPTAEYTIEVPGGMDPENVEITIENLGDTPIVNPRISVNGLYDWFDIKSMVAEITRDCKTDREKAIAIWWWVHFKRFQRSAHDHSSLHPVRAMNGYGYGICGHTAAWLKCMWTAAGLQARVQEIWGHTVSDVYFDGGWHMLDGNVKVCYLARDNKTIASLAELEKDAWLIERTIHSRDPWFRGPDPPGRNEQFVNYLITHKDNYEEHGYDSEIEKDYSMAMTLKPGEKLTRWWKPVLNKFEGRDKRALYPEKYANGRIVWEPDLSKIDMKDYIRAIDNVTTRGQDGQDPAIHVKELQDKTYTRNSRFSIPIANPYPVIGGYFAVELIKGGSSRGEQATVFYGSPGWGSGNLHTFRWGSGTQNLEFDLDSNILEDGNIYRYQIGFGLKGSADAKPPTQSGVDWFKSVSDLQVSPHSLPALALGVNVVRYRDESPGPKKIKITHKWREITDQHPPGAVTTAQSPKDGGAAGNLTPTLKWKAAKDQDKGDKVVDYQVMVSLTPDCRWPVSMTLYQNVGSDATEWSVPESFLNPGATYYWKVRARDDKDNIGPWGKIFSFKTE